MTDSGSQKWYENLPDENADLAREGCESTADASTRHSSNTESPTIGVGAAGTKKPVSPIAWVILTIIGMLFLWLALTDNPTPDPTRPPGMGTFDHLGPVGWD